METINSPVFEFDPDYEVISPSKLPFQEQIPKRCILCFFPCVYPHIQSYGALERVVNLYSPLGKHPIYVLIREGTAFSVFNPGLGGPMAAGFMEELIALGAEDFIVCGSAGVLYDIEVGSLILPSFAVRDEGTSFHYLKPSETVSLNGNLRECLTQHFLSHGIAFGEGGVWTTDAIYRETKSKITKRREQGCVCVDMETASLAAVAKFRNVSFATVLFAADSLCGDCWDTRGWLSRTDLQEDLFRICCDMGLE